MCWYRAWLCPLGNLADLIAGLHCEEVKMKNGLKKSVVARGTKIQKKKRRSGGDLIMSSSGARAAVIDNLDLIDMAETLNWLYTNSEMVFARDSQGYRKGGRVYDAYRQQV